jgi:hypothetical protein
MLLLEAWFLFFQSLPGWWTSAGSFEFPFIFSTQQLRCCLKLNVSRVFMENECFNISKQKKNLTQMQSSGHRIRPVKVEKVKGVSSKYFYLNSRVLASRRLFCLTSSITTLSSLYQWRVRFKDDKQEVFFRQKSFEKEPFSTVSSEANNKMLVWGCQLRARLSKFFRPLSQQCILLKLFRKPCLQVGLQFTAPKP